MSLAEKLARWGAVVKGTPAPICVEEAPLAPAAEPRRLPVLAQTRAASFVVYRGPSRFDGGSIVAIVTGATGDQASKNRKTGRMAQLWILRADQAPEEAQKSGADVSMCGSCPLRPAVAHGKHLQCYVVTSKGPRATWGANAEAPERLGECLEALRGSGVAIRLGAYGDPAALPLGVVEALASAASTAIGYTHDWREERSAGLRGLAMASCESLADLERARSAGWRVFRIVESDGAALAEREILCAATDGQTRCEDCRLCSGKRGEGDGRKDVAIPAHGKQLRPPAGQPLLPSPPAPVQIERLAVVWGAPSAELRARASAGLPVKVSAIRARKREPASVKAATFDEDEPEEPRRAARARAATPEPQKRITHKDIAGAKEAELVAAYKAGDRRAGATLLEAHAPLIKHWSLKYRNRGVDDDDLLQWGRMGFLHAAELLDATRGKLSTYAVIWIRQHVTRAVDNHGRTIRVPGYAIQRVKNARKAGVVSSAELVASGVFKDEDRARGAWDAMQGTGSLDAPIGGTGADKEADGYTFAASEIEGPYAACERASEAGALARPLGRLSARERVVIEEHTMGEATLEELGQRFGVVRERIRQIEAKALEKLRKLMRATKQGRELGEDKDQLVVVASGERPTEIVCLNCSAVVTVADRGRVPKFCKACGKKA